MTKRRLPPGTHSVAFAADWLDMSITWVNQQAVEHGLGSFEGRQRRLSSSEIRQLEKMQSPGERRGRPRCRPPNRKPRSAATADRGSCPLTTHHRRQPDARKLRVRR